MTLRYLIITLKNKYLQVNIVKNSQTQSIKLVIYTHYTNYNNALEFLYDIDMEKYVEITITKSQQSNPDEIYSIYIQTQYLNR